MIAHGDQRPRGAPRPAAGTRTMGRRTWCRYQAEAQLDAHPDQRPAPSARRPAPGAGHRARPVEPSLGIDTTTATHTTTSRHRTRCGARSTWLFMAARRLGQDGGNAPCVVRPEHARPTHQASVLHRHYEHGRCHGVPSMHGDTVLASQALPQRRHKARGTGFTRSMPRGLATRVRTGSCRCRRLRGRPEGCGRCSRALVGTYESHLHALNLVRLAQLLDVEVPHGNLRGVAVHSARGAHEILPHKELDRTCEIKGVQVTSTAPSVPNREVLHTQASPAPGRALPEQEAREGPS